MINFLEIIEIYRNDDFEIWINGPSSKESLLQLEANLKFKFPDSISDFILEFGSLGIGDKFISGIITKDPLELEGGNIYADTYFIKQDFPSFPNNLIVIQLHEDGAYCLDLNDKCIYNFEINELTKVAVNFEEFINNFYRV